MDSPVGTEGVGRVARVKREDAESPGNQHKREEKEELVKKVMKERPDLRGVWRFRNQGQKEFKTFLKKERKMNNVTLTRKRSQIYMDAEVPIGLATAGWALGKVMGEKSRLKFIKEWEEVRT